MQSQEVVRKNVLRTLNVMERSGIFLDFVPPTLDALSFQRVERQVLMVCEDMNIGSQEH